MAVSASLAIFTLFLMGSSHACAFLFSRTTAPPKVDCPRIVSRAEWQARPTKSSTPIPNPPVQYAFIHHSALPECFNQSQCAQSVREYQDLHMDTNGWDDIGYSFLIGGDGTVFEGRGWDRVGAHTLHYNTVGLGFCLIGDFTSHLPPPAQLEAVRQLIACGVSTGKIQTDYILRGHRDMKPTECPGDSLYAEIQTWPHY